MSPKPLLSVTYQWRLRTVMAEHALFATSDLVPLLAERGVVLSREQVYRLVAKVPERLNLTTLAALCDIFDCTPDDLIEPIRSNSDHAKVPTPRATVRAIQPRRARVTPEAKA